MKEVTAILLIVIALIGIISIIIVKLYYKDKEKDDEKERLEEFINSTKSDYDDEKRKRVRKTSRNRANYSEAQHYTNTINSQSKAEMKDARRARKAIASDDLIENENVGGTTALLRQRAKAMENAPKKQVRKVRKQQAAAGQVPKKVQRTPERVKTQMNKEEEVKSFQEPIKPAHTATINSAKQKVAQPKARQEPMTEKQKEFIASDANKLIVDDADGAVKVVKSVKPADSIQEIKESAKIEDAAAKTAEKDEVVEKAEKDTAELIKKIEEAKEGVEERLAETKETAKEEATKAKEIAKEEATEVKETIEEKITEVAEETKETPTIESTIEKIKQATEEKEETAKATEEVETEIIPEHEEPAVETESKAEKAKSTISEGTSKVSDKISEVAEKVYNDDLHLLLNKDKKVEVDESPENEFVTINSDAETSSTSNELISNAIQSIRNFRKPNVPEKPVIVEEVDDIVPDDYAQDLGNGIEYIGDTITITPIHEEEIDLANNQPNEDVDKIYKEINGESYNKTDDEDLSKSFEDVSDETSEKDANVYTKEDYEKIEAKEREKKRRVENTKKILGSKGISEEELQKRAEAKERSKRTRKTTSAEEPVEDGQKRLMMHKARTDVEEVYINGTLFELKVGQIVIYEIKGENYSSQILRLKPGYIGVRYRSKNIWVKSNTVKKILK